METKSCSGLTTEAGNPGLNLADERPMDDKEKRINQDSRKAVAIGVPSMMSGAERRGWGGW